MGPLFFWLFVKGAHGTANGLERVVLLVTPPISTRSSLPFAGGTPCRLFYCLRAPEPDRHAVPVLMILLLLLKSHLKEVEGASNEGTGPLGCGHCRGLFLRSQDFPPDVLWEIQRDFRKRSTTVPGSPVRTPKPANTLFVFE